MTVFHKIFIQLNLPSAVTVTLEDVENYFNKVAPTFTSSGMYDITYEFDNARQVWVVGSVAKGSSS